MHRFVPVAASALAFAPTAIAAQDAAIDARVAVESVTVIRPTVIGFFPPVTQTEVDRNESLSSALAHVQWALEDARKCLPRDSVDVKLVYATTLVLIQPGLPPTTFTFAGDSVFGAFLLAPGRPRQEIYPTLGPSALIPMLGQAAAAYFQRPDCDPFRD
jgi:hypothetical protein